MNVEVFTPSRGTFIEILGGGFGGGGGGFIIPPDVARKSLVNVFQRYNVFNGMRWVPRIINSADTVDYFVTDTDTVLWVDATIAPVTIHLLAALGGGQLLLVKKIDSTSNAVTVLPLGVDLVDGDPVVSLIEQWDWIEIIDVALGQWGNFSKLSVINLPDNIAYTDQFNVFEQSQSMGGLQLLSKVITEDYTVTSQDAIICVKADAGPISITLPPSQLDTSPNPRYAQFLYFKIISSSGNMVTVHAASGDTIDGATSVSLDTLYADLMVYDGAPNLWTDVGESTGASMGTSWGDIVGTLSDQLDLQAALNLKLNIPSPLPARPTTSNEIAQLLVDVGLCAP